MDSLYQIAKIHQGKGLGCVALNDIKKGTLILREKPQCFANQTDNSNRKVQSLSIHFLLSVIFRKLFWQASCCLSVAILWPFCIQSVSILWPFCCLLSWLVTQVWNAISDGGIMKIQGLIKSYNRMNKDDQEEYLKLYNKFKDLNFLTYEEKKHLEKQKKCLQEVFRMNRDQIDIFQEIYGIYFTNVYEMGLCLKTSRFNHSCVSNSQVFWNEKHETRDIRAVSKIKAGKEITVRYGSSNLEMKNFKIRQEHLWMGWKFNCCCPLCEEEAENCHDEKYENFESLKQEAETLFRQSNNPLHFGLDNMRREVQCYKEMYELAEEKQASRMFILSDIVKEGFNAAVQGYLQVMNNKLCIIFCQYSILFIFKLDSGL
jgi:hypothetical protein